MNNKIRFLIKCFTVISNNFIDYRITSCLIKRNKYKDFVTEEILLLIRKETYISSGSLVRRCS